jgi:hypothetical protein
MIIGEHRDQNVYIRSRAARVVRDLRSRRAKPFGSAPRTVVHGQRVPRGDQPASHPIAHVAEPNESDSHLDLGESVAFRRKPRAFLKADAARGGCARNAAEPVNLQR